MNSYRQILYHIIFCTYRRENTIPTDQHEELYRYIWGLLRKRSCVLYRINGTENHIHILCDLNSMLTLADLIKEIKTATNSWMHGTGKYPCFKSWAKGSCSLTYSFRDKDNILNYIKNQKEHHRKVTFEDEYKAFLNEHGIVADENYIF
jgi:putative transposase